MARKIALKIEKNCKKLQNQQFLSIFKAILRAMS